MLISYINSCFSFFGILREASLGLIYNISLSDIDTSDFVVSNSKNVMSIGSFLKKLDNIISLKGLPTFDTVGTIINNYWENIQQTGFGIAQIDDFLVFFVITRLILLAIRYNIITAFAISAISITAAYVWYSAFVSNLFMYEKILYKNSLTFRLGLDATQILTIMRGKVQSSDYRIRLSNPIGIIGYAIANGAIREGYFIDPLSMIVDRAPERLFWFEFKPVIISIYYLIYRKLIPLSIRALISIGDSFIAFGLYAYLTRVNKRYCPYLVRWHWTMLITMRFVEPFYCNIIHRLYQYSQNIVLPKVIAAQQYNLVSAQDKFELSFLVNSVYILIICHLGAMLYAMFHAICGQYFYVPFFIKAVELHVGPRDKSTIYSGGNTAWQDPEEKSMSIIPKLWYGWFGRGTKTPNLILYIIQKILFKPIYQFIKKIFKFIIRK